MKNTAPSHKYQRGTVLPMSMAFLTLLTLLGITAMNFSVLEEKMAGNLKDQYMAFQAAESALRDAEFDTASNAQAFTFAAGCASGLCTYTTSGAYVWDTVDWNPGSPTTRLYGAATSATALGGPLSEQPRYIVEKLPKVSPPPSGDSFSDVFTPKPQSTHYRLTARGVGATATAQAMVQSTFRK